MGILSIKEFDLTNFPNTLLCLYSLSKLLIWCEFCQNRLSFWRWSWVRVHIVSTTEMFLKTNCLCSGDPKMDISHKNSNRFPTISLPFLWSISIKVMWVYFNDLTILQNTMDRFARGFSQKNPRFPNWNI